jgi:hypothetical protein
LVCTRTSFEDAALGVLALHTCAGGGEDALHRMADDVESMGCLATI